MQVNDWRNILKTTFLSWCLCNILSLFAGTLHAADNTTARWNKANAFYTAKQYDSAALYYEELLKTYPENAGLQYNMGNACFRLNKTGAAILHYEKAAHLDPDNGEIKDNLLLAKSRIQNPLPEATPIFFVKWWDGLLRLFGPNTWAVIAFAVFAAILVLIYFARVRKERFLHSGRWLSLGIVSLLICICMAYFSYDAATNSGKAVVLQDAAGFRDAPGNTGKVLGNLPEGTVIQVYSEEGDFINVKLPNGREGWVAANAVGKV